MERASEFDIIHNNYDFHPLTYSRLIKTPMVTTIHGFSSPKIIPVYKKYNDINNYVSISNSDRNQELEYIATVYNGINEKEFRELIQGTRKFVQVILGLFIAEGIVTKPSFFVLITENPLK